MPTSEGRRVDLERLAQRLKDHSEVVVSRFLLRVNLANEFADDGNSIALTVFADGRSIVRGTNQVDRARSLVAKYLGG